jgi:hypothetical protein
MPGYFFMGSAVFLCGASVALHSCTILLQCCRKNFLKFNLLGVLAKVFYMYIRQYKFSRHFYSTSSV